MVIGKVDSWPPPFSVHQVSANLKHKIEMPFQQSEWISPRLLFSLMVGIIDSNSVMSQSVYQESNLDLDEIYLQTLVFLCSACQEQHCSFSHLWICTCVLKSARDVHDKSSN